MKHFILSFCFLLTMNAHAQVFQRGVNGHLASGEILNAVPETGMSWVRIDIPWAMIEPFPARSSSDYQWDPVDASVGAIQARSTQDSEVKILAVLSQVPQWASKSGYESGPLKDATAQEHWRQFVNAAAQRYQGRILHYEIWNEPNGADFWGGSFEEYAQQILIPAVNELRAVDPQIKSVGPALANLGGGGTIKIETFFKKLKAINGPKLFDIVSHHIYSKNPKEMIQEFTKGKYTCVWKLCWKTRASIFSLINGGGFENHKVWVTEFGWISTEVGEDRQGDYIVDSFKRMAQNDRFGAGFVYELQDDGRYNGHWGILDAHGQPKAAYQRLKDAFASSSSSPVSSASSSAPGVSDGDDDSGNRYFARKPKELLEKARLEKGMSLEEYWLLEGKAERAGEFRAQQPKHQQDK